jgi:hypothetical protein
LPYEVTGEKLIHLTTELLKPKFQDHLDQLQFKMQKLPTNDLERALLEMEYLMDIGDFDHLKSNYINQSFVESHNLDVYFLFLIIFMLAIKIFAMFFKFFLTCICCRKNKSKTKYE